MLERCPAPHLGISTTPPAFVKKLQKFTPPLPANSSLPLVK